MKASAAVEVVAADGRSRCTVLRSDPPFTFRQTGPVLSWIGTAAGPVGGDELALDVVVGPGADLTLGSVAASLVHPGPTGAPSSTAVRVTVGPGGRLRWQPRPVVLVRGCDHHADTTVDLADGAALLWREEVVLGRHEEEPGSLRQRLVVDRAGRPLLRTELAVGPRWPASLGPAGTAGARAVGTVVAVGIDLVPVAVAGVRMVVQPLAEGAVLLTALAERPGDLTLALDEASTAGAWGTPGPCSSSVSSWP
ncbi:MAG: urease accessory protein UreD [Actinomycetia bacterium]|nr:urease accessory protein UreD [Actinomycetes bacterium]